MMLEHLRLYVFNVVVVVPDTPRPPWTYKFLPCGSVLLLPMVIPWQFSENILFACPVQILSLTQRTSRN